MILKMEINIICEAYCCTDSDNVPSKTFVNMSSSIECGGVRVGRKLESESYLWKEYMDFVAAVLFMFIQIKR